MPRKIYDIKSPKVAHKAEKEIKDFFKPEKKKKRSVNKKKEKHSFPKFFIIIIAVILVLFSGFLYFKLQKVNIKIWPKLETLSYNQTITADQSAEIINLSENLIPAKYVEIEKKDSQNFYATGNASDEGKATGKITIYNKYNPATSITLKTGTHFLSDSGKYFKTLEKIVIPKATISGSKITPGSIETKVEAAEGGESYNIGPANFSVPKLSGSPYYYSIYAVSKEAMAGGYTGNVKKVTEDDIAQAKSEIIKNISSSALEDIKNQLDSDYILLDDAVSYATVNSNAGAKAGTVVDQFSYQATVKVSALAFKKSDLEDFAKDYIISEMSEDYTILDSSLKTEYNLKTITMKDKEIALEVRFSADIYKNINKNLLTLLLTGKTRSQINEIVNNNLTDSVTKVEVNFWPFWTTRSPKTQKAVEIELKF